MKLSPRDLFFNCLSQHTRLGEDVYIVTADFGAEYLDKFRKEFPMRFINVGIAEQNSILVATGLALEGKKVFVYGIASFITMRCFEQILVNLDGMDLPVTIIGVGVDNDYKEAGFTHWSYKDKNVFSTLDNMIIHDVTNKEAIPDIVDNCLNDPHPKYVRLRRK